MDLGLADRVVIVTGGSAGLGLAVARELVAEGARVVLSARSRDRLEAAVASLGRERAEGLAADLADPETPGRLLAAARTRFGRLDGALVSTGGPAPSTPTATSDEAWQSAFASAFLGPVRLARETVAAL
ncbi:MAG: SDR family NAD(P)-dependent oxidoreductase, partial [Actinomycetota bacterium]|nr:SDR family NAD(P)-dependent oxidoreductase [Actinomycetota bacterium]